MNKLVLPVLVIPQVVFFPKTTIPLIVEDRNCIQMILKCIKDKTPIALALGQWKTGRSQDQLHLAPEIICSYGDPALVESSPDGEYIKVLIQGRGKVQLTNIQQNIPHLIYEAYVVHDKAEQHSFAHPSIESLQSKLHEWAYHAIEDSLERDYFIRQLSSLHTLIDYICMLLIKDISVRQMLLENNSLYERIQILSSLLRHSHTFNEDQEVVQALKTYEQMEQLVGTYH